MAWTKTRGISTLAVLATAVVLALGYLGWNAYKKSEARAEQVQAVAVANTQLEKAVKRWSDAMSLAASTPRVGLAGPIAALQSIRLEVQEMAVPKCLHESRGFLVTGMNAGLEGMLAFMRQDVPKYEMDDYVAGKSKAMNESIQRFQDRSGVCPPTP